MLKKAIWVGALVAGIGLAGTAAATPLTFTDVINPADVFFANNSSNNPYSVIHDIRDSGFNPLTDKITSLSLTMRFRDDADKQPEAVSVKLDDLAGKDYTVRSGSCLCFPTVFSEQLAASLLQPDGILNMLLTRKIGDFWFMDSTLVATAERSQVPEPATALLAGLGLLGAGLARRRKSRR